MMSHKHFLRGACTALITPMQDDGSIDWMTLEKLVEAQIAAGIKGLVPVGTTGESPTLNTPEHLKVIGEVVRLANGRVPVIAGTGSNSTEEALHLTREADKLGADAFLQVAPYYNKPSQEGLYQHFRALAAATDKPHILYSIPGRCGIAIEVETVTRLATDCPTLTTIKEAGGDVDRVRQLRKACPQIDILSGDDGLILPFIREGALGVISVASNLAPEVIVGLTQACLASEWDKAEKLDADWKELLTTLVFLDGNPVTIKEVLFQAGAIPSPRVRLPLVRMAEADQARIRSAMANLNLLPA